VSRYLLVILAWLLVGTTVLADGPAGDDTDPVLAARLATLADSPEPVQHYREVRDGGLFSGAVTYTGRLEWREATGELIQWIDTPTSARLAVAGDRVEIQSGTGRPRTLPLSARPGLAAMMSGLRALLTGDVTALETVFTADYLEADNQEWLLHLKPRDAALREHLALLEVRGEDDRLVAIDRVGPEGRRETMTIVPAPDVEQP